MLTFTKQLRLNGFDDFIKSEKIVLVRLHDGQKENGQPDIDERIRKYFANEYGRVGRVAFGSLDTSEAFPKDLWLRKHLGSFADKGSGYYLASQGKLIAFHQGKIVRADSLSPTVEKLAKAGRPGWAAVVGILESVTAGQEEMPPETAQAIIEHFENALGQLPSGHE